MDKKLKSVIDKTTGADAANPAPQLSQAAKTVEKVTLLKPLRHRDKDYKAGTVLEVTSHRAAWLRERKVVAQTQDPA